MAADEFWREFREEEKFECAEPHTSASERASREENTKRGLEHWKTLERHPALVLNADYQVRYFDASLQCSCFQSRK